MEIDVKNVSMTWGDGSVRHLGDGRLQILPIKVPMWRPKGNGDWELVTRSLASPAIDGTVCYYLNSLSPSLIRDYEEGPPVAFDGQVAQALCRWLSATLISRDIETADGPYVLIEQDDGTAPRNWVVLRAMIWADEFDLVTPMDTESVSIVEDPQAMATR
jgi:hypothetical protein